MFTPNRPPARPFTDDELRALEAPTLVLLGERSVLLPARTASARVKELIPRVCAEIVPDVGHGVPLEAPELVNERILRFIATEAVAMRDGSRLDSPG